MREREIAARGRERSAPAAVQREVCRPAGPSRRDRAALRRSRRRPAGRFRLWSSSRHALYSSSLEREFEYCWERLVSLSRTCGTYAAGPVRPVAGAAPARPFEGGSGGGALRSAPEAGAAPAARSRALAARGPGPRAVVRAVSGSVDEAFFFVTRKKNTQKMAIFFCASRGRARKAFSGWTLRLTLFSTAKRACIACTVRTSVLHRPVQMRAQSVQHRYGPNRAGPPARAARSAATRANSYCGGKDRDKRLDASHGDISESLTVATRAAKIPRVPGTEPQPKINPSPGAETRRRFRPRRPGIWIKIARTAFRRAAPAGRGRRARAALPARTRRSRSRDAATSLGQCRLRGP